MRDKMRRRRTEPSIPIFSYYLTFIHYFGFSINQNSGNSSLNSPHSLSMTSRQATSNTFNTNPTCSASSTKQAKVFNFSTNSSPKSTLDKNLKTSCKLEDSDSDNDNDSEWFARYKSHESHQKQSLQASSLKNYISSALKKGIKFIAISFTTFLALNHCIVLVDYIYQGTMRFEELMFDFRLVITKISALIFVLSWHFNQSKVDKLIRLVKSTSVYILTTSSSNEINQSIPSSGKGVSRRLLEAKLSGRDNPGSLRPSSSNHKDDKHSPPNPQPTSWARDQSGERFFNEAFRELTRAQFEAVIKLNCGDKQERERSKVKGDKEIYSFTSKVNKRVLKWWLMCICITVLHFSLSEAEIFKSQHLWTWLDDYSMHQLSNKTTSLTTLMFLASFDNYIYTVHVYGARLIGASIICIACSLQRENIDFLRFQALRMLQVSSLYKTRQRLSEENKTRRLDKSITSRRAVDKRLNLKSRQTLSPPPPPLQFLNCDQKRENIVMTSKRIKLAGLSCSGIGENGRSLEGGASFIPSSKRNDNKSDCNNNDKSIDVSIVQQAWNLQIDDESENATQKSINNIGNNKVYETNYELDGNRNNNKSNNNFCDHDDDEVSFPTNRDLFFVLGESDWLELQENLNRLGPCGYLSSPLWRAREYLCSGLSELITGLVNMKKLKLFEKLYKNRVSCSRNLIMVLSDLMKEQQQVNPAVTCNCQLKQQRKQEQQQQQQQREQQRWKACPEVTPTPTCLPSDADFDGKTELPNQINAATSSQAKISLMKSNAVSGDELAYFQATPNNGEIIGERGQPDNFRINNDLFQQAGESKKTKPTTATSTNHDYPLFAKDDSSAKAVENEEAENLSFIQQTKREQKQLRQQNNPQTLNDDDIYLGIKASKITTTTRSDKANKADSLEQPFITPVNTSEMIEWQLEKLASKYELIRTVNSRIDSCFGPMLLIQYSFLFLMSCIDVVYFSICFNPNTKTKYIIISGMILLWWPYLLLYKFASDIGSSSKELLISVRRLARLSLVEHHQSSMLLLSQQNQQQHGQPQHNKCQVNEAPGSEVTCSPLARIMTKYRHTSYLTLPYVEINSKTRANNSHLSSLNPSLVGDYNLKRRKLRFQSAGDKQSLNINPNETTCRLSNLSNNNTSLYYSSNRSNNLKNLTSNNELNNCNFYSTLPFQTLSSSSSSSPAFQPSTLIGKTKARIINKLDHVFKPTNLSIIGIMTIDKFFLLNFAKIVITASVMVIQFISY